MKQQRTTKALIRILTLGAGIALTGSASAQTLISDVTYQYLGPTGTTLSLQASPNAAYSSLPNAGGASGSGSASGTPPRTNPLLDDFLPVASSSGQQVQTVRFVLWNSSGDKNIPAITQFGVWNSDGQGGAPGSFLFEGSRAAGYVTAAHDFVPGYTLVTLNLGTNGFTLSGDRLWAGLAFEQSTPVVPPGVGSVSSMGIVRTPPGPIIGQTNMGGMIIGGAGISFGAPVTNFVAINSFGPFTMEFVVPSPGAATLLMSAALLGGARRRRR